MKNLLYIGNNLNTAKANISSIQVLGALLESEGYDLRYTSSKRNKMFRLLDMLWSCIWNSKWADAVLIDTYSTQNFYYAYACSLVCRLFNIPYLPMLHGGNLPERLEQNPKLSTSIFNNSFKNISPSIYLKNVFSKKGYDNVEYIPNSILLENYSVYPKSFNTIRLLWVRSFSKIYNPIMAIEVLIRLKELGHEAELCMIGPDTDGSLEKVKKYAKNIGVKTRFAGKLTKEEWVNISEDYNIFMNTTNYDNMPLSIIEAMALGFPIASTDVGGIPFLIKNEEEGLLSPKNDANVMAKNIIRIFKDEKLRVNLSTNARKNAECFDWQSLKNQWHTIFKAL